MPYKVGLIVGREWSFPPAFIEEVNRRHAGVVAELVTLGAPRMDDPAQYRVIIDRISHEVPFYRTFLKHAVLRGVTVINNPFMASADDRFFQATLATSLGIASPKTVVLPNKEYVPGIVHPESLRNLQFPLDWRAVVEYVGLPCVLKDAHQGGENEAHLCHSLEELLHHYDRSGLRTMVVQEVIPGNPSVRCLCLGEDAVRPIRYDPREGTYHPDREFLPAAVRKRVVADSRRILRALGYDVLAIEWAIRDGIPCLVNCLNPPPDLDVSRLTPSPFEWVVDAMADLAIRLAKAKPSRRADGGITPHG
jgi:hypothetical protein